MNYTFPPRPVTQMADTDLRIGKRTGDNIDVFVNFEGFLKDWPPLLLVDREPYAFVQREETAVDEIRYGAHAVYIRSPRKGH